MKHVIAAAVAVCATFHISQTALAATFTYDLNGTLSEQTGASQTLISAGGTLGPTGYAFGANQGLIFNTGSLSGSGEYTIDFIFSFEDASGYRKIIDFSNRTSDAGLYNHGNFLRFYPVIGGASTLFTSGGLANVALTRTALGTVTGYVNGVQQFSFLDSGNLALLGSTLHFFRDDLATGSEASGGFVDYIRISDRALTAQEVAGLAPPMAAAVPGPVAGAGIPALMAFGGLVWARRRKAAAKA